MLAGVIGPAELTDLAERQAEREFSWPVTDLERLAAVADGNASRPVRAVVRFGRGATGLVRLQLAVSGQLVLECQRCLGPVEWPVELTADLDIVPDETAAGRLPDPIDAVALTPEGLPLAVLVEDEVLAALPLAPKHRDPAGCTPSGAAAGTSGGQNRPFSGLGALLRSDREPGGE